MIPSFVVPHGSGERRRLIGLW